MQIHSFELVPTTLEMCGFMWIFMDFCEIQAVIKSSISRGPPVSAFLKNLGGFTRILCGFFELYTWGFFPGTKNRVSRGLTVASASMF